MFPSLYLVYCHGIESLVEISQRAVGFWFASLFISFLWSLNFNMFLQSELCGLSWYQKPSWDFSKSSWFSIREFDNAYLMRCDATWSLLWRLRSLMWAVYKHANFSQALSPHAAPRASHSGPKIQKMFKKFKFLQRENIPHTQRHLSWYFFHKAFWTWADCH